MAIVKWDPFREMDRIFDDSFALTPIKSNIPRDLSVDVYEKNGNVIAEMHIAGMEPENFDIFIDDKYLSITGSKEESKEEKEKNYYYREIQRGSFERTVKLPVEVNEAKVEANYENGILQIVMPKKDTEKKRKKVQVESKKQIEQKKKK